MKSLPFIHSLVRAALALVCIALLTTAADAANTKPNAKPSSTNTTMITNSAALEVVIPQSVFEFGGKGVKDPFFPLSTRIPHTATQPTVEVGFSPSWFKLKGLSGTPANPLALINNRTVATGEPALVTTPGGKMKIHCLEIKKISVIIRVEGQFEPIEIFLPKGDR